MKWTLKRYQLPYTGRPSAALALFLESPIYCIRNMKHSQLGNYTQSILRLPESQWYNKHGTSRTKSQEELYTRSTLDSWKLWCCVRHWERICKLIVQRIGTAHEAISLQRKTPEKWNFHQPNKNFTHKQSDRMTILVEHGSVPNGISDASGGGSGRNVH